MKRIDFYYFLTLILTWYVMGFELPHFAKPKKELQLVKTMSLQQRSSHYLDLLDEKGEDVGLCTGTAIGPNAILTAEHCIEHTKATQVRIDASPEKHTIVAHALDGRDHILLLLDGSPFRTFVHVQESVAVIGESVSMYGVGGQQYPPVPKYGKAIDCQDPSDVDEDDQIFCTTLPVVPGDSGAAVYNFKGEILGLVTYEVDNVKEYDNVNFALKFSLKTLKEAETFNPKKLPL